VLAFDDRGVLRAWTHRSFMEKGSVGPGSKHTPIIESQAILVAPESGRRAPMTWLFFSNLIEPHDAFRPFNLSKPSELLVQLSERGPSLHGFEISAFPGNQECAPGESENQREREK